MTSKDFQLRIFNILNNWVPPALLKYVLILAATVRYLFYSHDKESEIKRTIELKGLKKSNKAFIMATGPSIKQLDTALLAGADVYSVSNFFLHDEIQNIDITAHFFANYHEPLILAEYIAWLESADKILPKSVPLLLGYPMKEIINAHQMLQERDIYYFCFEKEFTVSGLAIDRPFLSPHSSPILLLSLAIALGYSEIYLCGCDHTNLRDYKGTVKNFYDKDKDLRSNATEQKWWNNGVKAHVQYLLLQIDQYEALKKLADQKGLRVYNLSEDSWLEVFPRPHDSPESSPL